MGRSIRALIAVALALSAAGCARAGAEPVDRTRAETRPQHSVPSHMTGRYSDGRIIVRYPRWWSESRSSRFGTVFADSSTRHAGFVSVKYLPESELPARRDFPAFAADVIRPGGPLIALYTQAARIGGLRGIETAFIWPMIGPRGPHFRAYGFDLGREGVAFVIFASERPETHARDFAWVKRGMIWLREPGIGGPRPQPGGNYAPGY